jgi:Spy/CpxP family protein refolding chaperone
MRDNILKFVLALSLLLNLSMLGSAGYAHFRQSRMHAAPLAEFHKPGGSHFFEQLDLRPEQLDAIRGKVLPFHDEITKKRQEIEKKSAGLVLRMRAENPDRAAIGETIAEISKAQAEVQRMVVAHMLELKAEMDREQQESFLDLVGEAMTKQKDIQCP